MDIHFVFIEPQRPENIGACARAMKTMGFQNLILVNPEEKHLTGAAMAVAHRSGDILSQAKVFPTFKEAVTGFDFVLATTADARRVTQHVFHGEAAFEHLKQNSGTYKKVAIVFGRESRGMTNTELSECDAVATLPMANTSPTLNLGQAAMLYAYELSKIKNNVKPNTLKDFGAPRKDDAQFSSLKEKVSKVLDKFTIARDDRSRNKILSRLSLLNYEDQKLVHGICAKLSKD